MKSSKYLAVLLAAAMLAGSTAITASAKNEPETETYVLMNIPYSQFYQADVRNDVQVDVFTSATKTKTRTGTLAGGSYHTDSSGDAVEGVTFPVKLVGEVDLSAYKQITDNDSLEITVTNRGKTNTTTYTGKETLFENPDYSYYVLDSEPAFYKEVVQNPDGSLSFSETKGEAEEITAEVELTKDSKYGDYQMNISSDDLKSTDEKPVTVYGVVISTKEGNDYGLRHLENIWRNTSLAWCTGFTNEVHGCVTKSAHYEKMMGQTINKVTYFTSDGKKTFDTSIYVPVKTGASAAAESAAVSDGQTTFTSSSFAEDFSYSYKVTNDSDEAVDMTVANGTITYPTDTPNGKYTLTISDAEGKYASVVTDFELTAAAPAQFNGKIISEEPGLVAAEGAAAEELADFLENIANVTVGEKTYNASGKGAVKLIDTDTGLIDVSNTDVFPEDAEEFTVTVKATGYDPLTFTLTMTQKPVDDPTVVPTDNPKEEPSVEPTDKPTDESADNQTKKTNDNSSAEPTNDPTVIPTENKTAEEGKNASDTPSQTENANGVSVPNTADAAAATGAVMALITASAGAMMLLGRKRKNEK